MPVVCICDPKHVGGLKWIGGPDSLAYCEILTLASKKGYALGSREMPRGGNASWGEGFHFVMEGAWRPHGFLNIGISFALIRMS